MKHKQVKLFYEVDAKMKPVIDFIVKNFGMLTTLASCQGPPGNGSSMGCYVMLIVRDMNQLHGLCEFLEIWHAQYNVPNANNLIPTWRIVIPDLDKILKKIASHGSHAD